MTPSHSHFNKNYEIRMKFSTIYQTFVRKVSAQVKTSYLLIYRSTKLLKLYVYRVSVIPECKPSDCPKRVEFCQRLFTNFACNKAGFYNFFFSDEAWFVLDE